MKNLKLNKGLSRDEMRTISGGRVAAEYQCWCDGIRNGYCDGNSVSCCQSRCDGSISGSHVS